MKNKAYLLLLAVVLCAAAYVFTLKAADTDFQTYEYATIRWSGRENTHLIRANGKVEFLAPILTRVPRPDRVDDRAFYMNIALNAAAKEGYELASMTNDEMLLKRPRLRE